MFSTSPQNPKPLAVTFSNRFKFKNQMIYSNDESDKSIRQKNFYLTVYLLPIATAAIICGVIYLLSQAGYLHRRDVVFGYMLSLTPAILVYLFNNRNWLKMPDGTYHNIKGISQTNIINLNEPKEYEAEYFYSKKEKATSAFLGLLIIGLGIWFGIKDANTILIPIATIIGGIFYFYTGIKGLLDKKAKLKLAKKGIWTNKLGFVDWNDLIKAQVIEDRSGRTTQTILEIYLKGTVYSEAHQPDERLSLTDIDDKEMIETVIDTFISKRNELSI